MSEPQNQVDHDVQIVPGDEEDNRSEIESIASSSTSLAASIRDYHFENGRTYHRYKAGSKTTRASPSERVTDGWSQIEEYYFPNDEKENDRLDLQHHLALMTLGGRLGLAPPCDPEYKVKRALDVGTGTGIWAIQFADDHPEAEVYGTDLSPIQPDFLPPNVKFEIDDVEEEWTWSRPFDYIHSRHMTGALSNWKEYITRCYQNLTPGGYLELQETEAAFLSDDDTLPPDSQLVRFTELLKDAAAKWGRHFVQASWLKAVMVEVGFEDVQLSRYKWPVNAWPRDDHYKALGMYNNENVLVALDGLIMAYLTRSDEWTREEVEVFLIGVRKEVNNRAHHAYAPMNFLTGRKPVKKDDDPAEGTAAPP